MSEFHAYTDLLPDGGIPVLGIRVLEFTDAEGELHYTVGTSGDLPLASYVGMLELAKRSVIDDFYDGQE